MRHRYYVERDDKQYPRKYFTKLSDAKEYCTKANFRWMNHREYVYSVKTGEIVY